MNMTQLTLPIKNVHIFSPSGQADHNHILSSAVKDSVITNDDLVTLENYAQAIFAGHHISDDLKKKGYELNAKLFAYYLQNDKPTLESQVSLLLSKELGIYPDTFGKINPAHASVCYSITEPNRNTFTVLENIAQKEWYYEVQTSFELDEANVYLTITSINDVLNELKTALEKHNADMVEVASKAISATKVNVDIPEIGSKEYQIKDLVNYLHKLKDSQAHDDIQLSVLKKYTDDDICDLPYYDDTCDIRSQYEIELSSEIDDLIENLDFE